MPSSSIITMMWRNNSTAAPSVETIRTTFWIVYIIEAALPIIVFVIGAVCKKSFQKIIKFDRRNLNYDTQLLRRPEARTPFARFFNIAFCRHRPLPLELLRICIEITILLHILGYVGLVVLLSLWCIFDLAQGLHVLNLVYLRHTPTARSATSLATYISTMYSLLYGFPLGFISKLMWIVWIGARLRFATILIPLYIEAVAALVFALFFMLPNMCWRASVNGCKSILTRFQILLLIICFFTMWLLMYFNVSVCEAPPVEDPKYELPKNQCMLYFRSWTTSLLPVMVLLSMSQFVLLWATANKGMVYRFLPEITFMWSGSLVFASSVFAEDGGPRAVLDGTSAVLLFSIIITIVVNYILLTDIMKGLKAPVILHSQSSSRASEVEVKRRMAMRQSALKDYIHEGGKTMLKGTLLRYLKKRDRTKECVVCLDSFKKTKEIQGDAEINEEAGTATDDLLGIIRKCGHYFHFNCVWDWIQMNNTCPLCRTNVQVTKDVIKTVHYDDVRYVLEWNKHFSTVGTVSEMVSKASDSSVKNRPAITGTMFNRDGVAVEVENEQSGIDQPKCDITAAPSGSYVVGDQSISYKNHSRSSTKYCGICKDKFQTHREAMDIVVGYLRSCGHYFHFECIDSYIREQEKCPTCQSLDEWHARRAPAGAVPDLTASSSQSEGVRHKSEDRSRHGRNMREPTGNPPPRGSRRHREKSRHQHKPRSRSRPPPNADLVSPRSVRDFSSPTNQNVPDIVQTDTAVAGPSRPRNGYIRNPKSSNHAMARPLVHSEDILFAFLSDVQTDIKRSRGRKVQNPVHVV